MTPEEKREYHREYRKKNAEKLRQKRAEWKAKNQEGLRKKEKEYRERTTEKRQQYQRDYRERNRETLAGKTKERLEKNRERYAANQRARNFERRDELSEKRRRHRKEHPEIYKERYRKNRKKIMAHSIARRSVRIQQDELFRFREQVRGNIKQSIKRAGRRKSGRTEAILGCSYTELREYLNVKFTEMYGTDIPKDVTGYELHHITPICTAQNEEDIIRLNHHTNLVLLTVEDHRNLHKGESTWF